MSYLLNDDRQQFLNALRDPRVEFAIVPSPRLRELIATDAHPAVQKLPPYHKFALLTVPDGKAIPVGRGLVLRYIDGKCDADEKLVLDLCDVRFWQSPNVVADEKDLVPHEGLVK